MTCPECRATITGLSCSWCMVRRSREAYRARQHGYIQQVLDGTVELRLVRTGHRGPRHFVLFEEHTHTYCGLDATAGKQSSEEYMEHGRSFYCADCLKVFDAIVREVTA